MERIKRAWKPVGISAWFLLCAALLMLKVAHAGSLPEWEQKKFGSCPGEEAAVALPPGRCHAAGTGRFQELKVSSAPAVFQNLAELPLENWDGFLAECFYLISLQIKKRSNRRHMFSISFTCVLLCLKERGMKCLASVFSISVQTTAGAHHYY